jgi:hypothetical protein
MNIFVYIYIYIYIYIYMYINTFVYIYMYLYICIYTYIYIHIYICKHVNRCISMQKCKHICIFILILIITHISLGMFGLDGARHLINISELSGGQKSRVLFASIALKSPHILGTYICCIVTDIYVYFYVCIYIYT